MYHFGHGVPCSIIKNDGTETLRAILWITCKLGEYPKSYLLWHALTQENYEPHSEKTPIYFLVVREKTPYSFSYSCSQSNVWCSLICKDISLKYPYYVTDFSTKRPCTRDSTTRWFVNTSNVLTSYFAYIYHQPICINRGATCYYLVWTEIE